MALATDLAAAFTNMFGVPYDAAAPPFRLDGKPASDRDAVGRAVMDRATAVLEEKEKRCAELTQRYAELRYPQFHEFERDILLRILDMQWKDHLHTMDGLREGIGLRGYAARDPKLEYQREGYALFNEMNERIDLQAVELLFKFVLPEPALDAAPRSVAPARSPAPSNVIELRSGADPARPVPARAAQGPAKRSGKVGRNDPCICGSGKKYKKCCGAT